MKNIEKILIFSLSISLTMCIQPNQDKLDSMLVEAVKQKKADKSIKLIQKGANVNQFVEDRVSLLHQAIYAQDTKVVKALVEAGADVNLPDDSRKAPLTIAASYGYHHMVDILLKHGAEINHRNGNVLQTTAAMEAAGANSIEVLKILIKYNADLEIKDTNGDPALNWACFVGAYETTLFLIDAGVDIELAGPLDNAIQSGNKKLVEYLRSQGFKSIKEMM